MQDVHPGQAEESLGHRAKQVEFQGGLLPFISLYFVQPSSACHGSTVMCATLPAPPQKRQSQGTTLKPLKLQVEINLFCLGTDYLQRFIVGQEAD